VAVVLPLHREDEVTRKSLLQEGGSPHPFRRDGLMAFSITTRKKQDPTAHAVDGLPSFCRAFRKWNSF